MVCARVVAGASITLPPIAASMAYQIWRPAPFAIAMAIGGGLLLAGLRPASSGPSIVHDEQ